MKQILQLLILLLKSFGLSGQTSYSGYIDKYPIELVAQVYSDGVANAFYVYTNFDNPIKIDGTLKKGILTLFEKDSLGIDKAVLTFRQFNADSFNIQGVWKDLHSSKELKIVLTKSFDIDYGDSIEWRNKELLQSGSLKDKYFKLVVSKEKDNFYANGTGIKVFEKKTDKLIQEFRVECSLFWFNNVSAGDYNFDGFTDFSVLEHSGAGPNITSLYFLFNPRTGKYFRSSFKGVSLEFDEKKKRIYEHNQWRMGQSYMNAEYKVVNNKMVLIKKGCFEYDEKIADFKKVKCE